MTSDLHAGALVRVRGEQWRLARVDTFHRCTILTLEGRDGSNRGRRIRLLAPFDRPTRVPTARWRRRSRRAVIASALSAIAAARPAGGLWAAARASIDLHAYQLEPAMAVLRGATRVLLADAVGLGKTIQAGLILAELRERGWVDRALIVCPAGLRTGWIEELDQRFGIEAASLDQEGIAEAVSTLPSGVNPWTTATVAVASIDYIKRADVLAAAAAAPFDLLVVDEAHHAGPGTDRGRAVERLAAQTPWCVFASATPHSGDQAAFDYLCSLGAHGDRLTVFRRSRIDAGLATQRRSHVLAVHPQADEAELLAAVDHYAEAIWRARGRGDAGAQLLAITIARRAASSPLAIERTLTRRLSLLAGGAEPRQTHLPWEEEDDEVEAVLGVAGLDDAAAERTLVETLVARARRCGCGSKIRRALRLAARARQPVILFTEFRDTVDAVLATIPRGRRVLCVHGGMPARERRQAVDGFNGGSADLLIATDAAGEGLNLHHRCRLVVDLELPWNPLRLEQRVGRVDRLGQRRRVHAVRLFHPGGIEARVLRQLQRRQLVADIDVARAIFDEATADTPVPVLHGISIAGASEEAGRLEQARRVMRRVRELDPTSWTPPRRPRSAAALRRVTLANRHGSLVEERLEAWRIDMSSAVTRKDWQPLVASVSDRLPSAVTQASILDPSTLSTRIHAIRDRLTGRDSDALQPSLFDRRAEERAAREHQAAARNDAALQRCLEASDGVACTIDTTLVAAWSLQRR